MMKQPEQRFSFYSSAAPGLSICVLSIAFRDQSHYSIVQFMRYVPRGGFTNFVTMPYLGEEGQKL